MVGRDPHEPHRTATPLELLFDLTFATCFGYAATLFANALAAGHSAAALIAFGFASLAICWAWINFSWFSSAYDTDDWVFRIVTLVQMIGVLVLAAGLPRLFASIERTGRPDNSVMVFGYVIMRTALVFQWLRAAREDPARRRLCLIYAVTIAVAQIGWVVQILVPLAAGPAIVLGVTLGLIEMSGPVLAERQAGGTPWHARHIAERYSLFAIIALGEGVVGTVAALSAVIDRRGWTLAVLVGFVGMGLTFGMWWLYFLLPSAELLRRHRDRAPVWGYLQMLAVTSIVATGAGLRVAAYYINGRTSLTIFAAVLTVAIPLLSFLVLLHVLYYCLVRKLRPIDAWLLITSGAVTTLAVSAAWFGVGLSTSLVILLLAPTVTIFTYEVLGYRYQTALASPPHDSLASS